jgi:hypothetical protein
MQDRPFDMNPNGTPDDDVPTLTDAVEMDGASPAPRACSAAFPDLNTALVARIHDLAESLVHQSCRELEAVLLERIADRLKAELPDLIDRILREHAEELDPDA